MAEYAKDALETETPWERWECKHREGWIKLDTHPAWYADREYRRKPKTVSVNGIELPAPYRGEMEYRQLYFVITNTTPATWNNDPVDLMRRETGQLHLTKEAADLWREALKKITSCNT
jgi:hypothetical protein